MCCVVWMFSTKFITAETVESKRAVKTTNILQFAAQTSYIALQYKIAILHFVEYYKTAVHYKTATYFSTRNLDFEFSNPHVV